MIYSILNSKNFAVVTNIFSYAVTSLGIHRTALYELYLILQLLQNLVTLL